MIGINTLKHFSLPDLQRIAGGYTAHSRYEVTLEDTGSNFSFQFQLIPLTQPYVKTYDHFNEAVLREYTRVLTAGYSFGAYDDDLLVGLLIGEPQAWNRSLWVHEFHVAYTHQRLGIGRRLMERAAQKALTANLRIIVCETQNTNPDAIAAYHRLGFRPEGVDISYYSNQDYPGGEVAIFMKKRLS